MQISDPIISGIESKWRTQRAALESCLLTLSSVEDASRRNNYILDQLAEELAKDNARVVFNYAEKYFSAPGCNLSISHQEILSGMCLAEKHCRVQYRDIPSFVKVWDALQLKYGSGIGQRLATIAVANQLAEAFRLRWGAPVWVRGGIMLTHSVNKETYTNDPGQISYTSRDTIGTVMGGLIGFASHITNSCLSEQLIGIKTEIDRKRGLLTLREKLQAVGDNDDEFITITTFFSKIEYHFSPKLTEVFQVFIAEFATSLQMDGAA